MTVNAFVPAAIKFWNPCLCTNLTELQSIMDYGKCQAFGTSKFDG